MLYKKLTFQHDNEQLTKPIYNQNGDIVRRTMERDYVYGINRKLESIFKEKNKDMYICIYDVDEKQMDAICAYRSSEYDIEACIETLESLVKLDELIEEEEITNRTFILMLDKASNNDVIHRNANRILDELEANVASREGLFEKPYFELAEEIYDSKLPTLKQSLQSADKILASDSMVKELRRIYSKENEKVFYGHPVHYYLTAGSWSAALDMVDVLIPALLKNNRLQGKRVTYVNKISPNANRFDNFRNIFSSCSGSAVVVDLSGESSVGNFATGYQKNAKQLGKFLAEYGKDTLFIFVEVVGNVLFRDDNLGAIIGNSDIVRIEEGFGDFERAKNYLNDLVDKSNFVNYKEPDMEKYLPEKLTYSVSDVFTAFDKWYGRGLKSHIYKAYKEFESVKIEKTKTIGKPYQKLKEMVGLVEIKDIINQVIAYEKIQTHRKNMGMEDVRTAKHMLFYGEPGTAKTTVARLMGQILKEEGILDVGHVVECGRQDLVGLYVGWTAKIVEEKFKEARGGILFIDEAYSLCESDRHFGVEAINTLVQLMENYRDEVLVILAGYPLKMEKFINSNEGLRSRIAFQLNFPNYDNQELVEIMELMLKERNLTMTAEAIDKCSDIFKSVKDIPNFGNGRFVRNFLDQIEHKQAMRLSNELIGQQADKETLNRIELSDIPDNYHFLLSENENKKMGLI